jgi:hypothetical protein
VDLEVVGVRDGTPIAAEGPDDHPVLVQDPGVLELTLVGIANGDGGWVDEGGVGADRQQAESDL